MTFPRSLLVWSVGLMLSGAALYGLSRVLGWLAETIDEAMYR